MMSRGRYRGSSRFSPLYVGFGIGGAILSGALFARLAAYTRQADCPPGPNGYPHNDASRKFRPPRGSGGALHEFWRSCRAEPLQGQGRVLASSQAVSISRRS